MQGSLGYVIWTACYLAVLIGLSVAGLSVALSGSAAWAQSGRTIKIVVPFPPGGGVDAVARIMAEQIGRDQGPSMVIENRPGAGTAIGAAEPFSHKRDGLVLRRQRGERPPAFRCPYAEARYPCLIFVE